MFDIIIGFVFGVVISSSYHLTRSKFRKMDSRAEDKIPPIPTSAPNVAPTEFLPIYIADEVVPAEVVPLYEGDVSLTPASVAPVYASKVLKAVKKQAEKNKKAKAVVKVPVAKKPAAKTVTRKQRKK